MHRLDPVTDACLTCVSRGWHRSDEWLARRGIVDRPSRHQDRADVSWKKQQGAAPSMANATYRSSGTVCLHARVGYDRAISLEKHNNAWSSGQFEPMLLDQCLQSLGQHF